MITSGLIVQILTYLVPLVAGYLLRHFGITIPGLPAPVDNTPTSDAHVSLLQQLLNVSKSEAEVLLKSAVQDVVQKGLADLKSASQPAASAPAAPAK